MLEPDDRHTLLDALRPPPGFSLDRAVGTTFSLDLYALLTAPLAFALLEAESGDESLSADTAVLESVRRNAGLIDVFCQAGQIALPAEYRPLVAYIEGIVHEVTAPRQGRVFHPKVWAIRFRSPGGERRYRALCLSRNLTFDRSWDTVLRLEGSPARRSRRLTTQNRPLSRFVAALPGLARDFDTDRAEDIRLLADELLAVEFELPAGFYGLRFWPLGLRGLPGWPFEEEGWSHSRLLAVSPFLSPALLRRLGAPGSADVLISRPDTLDSLGGELGQFEEILTLSPAANDVDDVAAREVSAEDEELAERPDYPLRGLHAKLFVSEYHHMARLWTGSANATNAAFGGNVEFLVELQGARGACGVNAILQGQLRELLENYQPPDAPPSETVEQRLERKLDNARREIAALGFEATIASRPDEAESYSLVLRAKTHDDFDGLRGLRGRVWPITIASDSARPLTSAFTSGARFSPVSFGALTAFFGIELTARSRGVEASVRFAVTADLIGAPHNRDDRLLTSILRSRREVLRYLLLLLADESFASSLASVGVSDGDSSDGWAAFGDRPVLESMIRALARDPGRIDHVARLVASLKASEEGRELIPEGLDSVLDPILAARKRLRA
jgi:hypothetical protein